MKKTESISSNRDFKRLYHRGKSKASKFVVIYFLPNKKEINRLGITVSKKLGKAVLRNRARRLIKESYRLLEPNIKTGFDIVLVSRHSTVNSNCNTVQESIRCLLKEQNLLIEN